MNENAIWGAVGILLAIAGAVVIGLEMTQSDLLTQLYGVGVILAAIVTVLIVAPSLRSA
ncbi:hypothetical protein [Halalkalirubrum salinum]|uniref:hypothetical protein n=1 Tax=Halalkalirubrum salinum TaxID=2563889 RepID=UPI0014852AEE|nr:hypothetical protein [Halalkalirubrum salinum]